MGSGTPPSWVILRSRCRSWILPFSLYAFYRLGFLVWSVCPLRIHPVLMFSCYPSDSLSILVRILFRPLLEISSKFSIYDFDLSILSSTFAGEPWAFPQPRTIWIGLRRPWVTFNGLEIGFKFKPAIARTLHELPPARSHRPIFPDISGVSHRRLRQTKSHTLPRKRRKIGMDISTRARSVAANRSSEKNPTMSISPGGSPKRGRKSVCFFICAVNSTRRGDPPGEGCCRSFFRTLPRSKVIR